MAWWYDRDERRREKMTQTVIDDFTLRHLATWLENHVFDDEREAVTNLILGFVARYPEMLADHSWSEIRSLAEYETA
jgi:hypothetical protein